ncbi:MAG: KEOPS complex kinase/ATPase Bud32 [Candidatus Nanosalina sp.]
MERGAEAVIRFQEDSVEKKRVSKNYRHEKLDERIREQRTEEELRNIRRARKYGVNVPETEKKSENTLSQEIVEGKKLRDVIEENKDLMEDVGENIGRMHSADVIHGDLTTSNIMYDGEIKIIDFGLSQVSDRIEDKAVDIHLLKQVMKSSHPKVSDKAWKKFLNGYRSYEESKKVLRQLEEVESRGRYK